MSTHKPLTAIDVAAIKNAAKLGFKIGNHSHLGVRYDKAEYTVDVNTDIRQPEGSDPSSVSRRVTIAATGTNEMYRSIPAGDVSFYAGQDHGYHGARQSVLGSLANIVRTGDALHVVFVIGNDTERMKKAGLTRDDAHLTVVRNDKMVASFQVGTTIGNGANYSGMVMS